MATRAAAKVVIPPKAYSYFRMVIGGFIEAEQTWSVSFAFRSNPNTSQEDMQTWLEARRADVEAWWTYTAKSPQSNNTPDTTLSTLTLYQYLANVKGAQKIAQTNLNPLPGTSTRPGTARDSLVVSLYGTVPGVHYRGRIYVPTTGPFLGIDHQFTGETTQVFVDATKNLLVACGTHQMGGINPLPVIASSLPEPPLVHTIRCDTLPDTQRKRSDKIGKNSTYVQTLVIA